MKTEYKYSYFTQMDSTHWLCNAPGGIDLGEIYYSFQCWSYVYYQPAEVAINIKGLEEVLDFMKQL